MRYTTETNALFPSTRTDCYTLPIAGDTIVTEKINFKHKMERKKKSPTLHHTQYIAVRRTDIRDANESAALHNSSTGHSSSRPVGRKQTLNTW